MNPVVAIEKSVYYISQPWLCTCAHRREADVKHVDVNLEPNKTKVMLHLFIIRYNKEGEL
jgi:hypothetical protein